ncbi:ARPP-2 domain-containing protein [Streptomyces sp.]|uniref:ARPP-2 domain-containing protein n=1 Tax=Streptomyces sp. TaxID=1931 RepID=UPI002F42A565
MTPRRPFRLDLAGLAPRPAQVWGGIRLVPLVRDEPLPGLRLHARLYEGEAGPVSVRPGTAYVSYIPHGFVADWGADAGHTGPGAAYGTHLRRGAPEGEPVAYVPVRAHRRMVQREAKRRLRFLPLHLAVEGYLALHFGGPPIAWDEWSRRALRTGLSPRVEEACTGAAVRGLSDALRVFELHPGQCGVMVYAADALATAFVVPHPDDFRALHTTLINDLYGELVHHYALLSAAVPDFVPRLPDVAGLAQLRAAVAEEQRGWAAFHDGIMAADLLGPEYIAQTAYRAGDFTLLRFLPPFRPHQENHIGEAITAPDGRVGYLKTFRLSETQTRRGHLLTRLAAHDWHLSATATDLGLTDGQLALRLESAGFGFLLRPEVLAAYRRAAKPRTNRR